MERIAVYPALAKNVCCERPRGARCRARLLRSSDGAVLSCSSAVRAGSSVVRTCTSVVRVGVSAVRTSRIHYIAPEFVARQRVGRRWLFRESAGIGYGRYIRGYAGLTGSRGGVGIHESVSAEFMLTRFLGLGVTVGGQWLIVDSPDVDDGAELNLAGIFRVQLGGGIRFYF